MKVKTSLTDYRGKEITFGNDYADKLLKDIKEGEGLKIGDFEGIWASSDERDYNSYNGSFLGNAYLVKWYNDRQYLAFHRSGDVRGNYTDFVDITDSNILDEVGYVNATIEIESKGKKYTSYNQQNYDTFYFEPIEELELDANKLEELWDDNE